ncbi:MAG: hypothetical protein M5T61_06335 [Acidimicrobiia bacterium]|nr:hypothetical protein [Acidimicrobiia bacterium]
MTLRRLVSTAVAGAGPGDLSARRRRRATASIAGIAAAVLVVAGIGTLMLGGTDDSSDDAASGGATVADEMEALEPSADLGEVSDPSVLRDLLREAAPLPAPAAAEAQERVAGTSSELSAGDSTEDAPHSPTTGATGGDGDGSTRGLPETDEGRGDAAGDGIDCSTLLAADFEDVGAPLLLATATYDGEPAGVIVLSGDGGDLAVVYSQGDCTILATQTLTAPDRP